MVHMTIAHKLLILIAWLVLSYKVSVYEASHSDLKFDEEYDILSGDLVTVRGPYVCPAVSAVLNSGTISYICKSPKRGLILQDNVRSFWTPDGIECLAAFEDRETPLGYYEDRIVLANGSSLILFDPNKGNKHCLPCTSIQDDLSPYQYSLTLFNDLPSTQKDLPPSFMLFAHNESRITAASLVRMSVSFFYIEEIDPEYALAMLRISTVDMTFLVKPNTDAIIRVKNRNIAYLKPHFEENTLSRKSEIGTRNRYVENLLSLRNAVRPY